MFSVLSRFRKLRPPAPAAPAGRPELLRRQALAANARIIIGASLLASPVAMYELVHGALLGFVVSIIGLSAGVLTLALCRRGQFERAAAGQAYGLLLAGLVMTIGDPAIVDFGLATALLGPVHASMLARSPVKKRSWVLLVGIVAFAAASSTGLLFWPEALRTDYIGVAAIAFAVAAIIVAYTANRLNSAFEVYDKAQINAYRHLIENVQDAVMRFSADGQVLFTSRSSEKLFGCQRYELSGSGLLDRIHVLDRPAYMTAFADANIDGKARVVEVRMRRDDPTAEARVPHYFWVEVGLSPVTEDGARPERFEVVALLRDVTARKDIETEMRDARKLAEENSSAKSRFLATIGHELRTPLNAIVGFSEMMTSGVVGEMKPAHKEYAELIRQSGRHLIDIVGMLLDMSRIEAGRFELQTESFQPDALLEPCLRIVDSMAKERNIRLRTELPRSLPAIIADERACRQILINLLSNAIKFSPEGAEVTVSLGRRNNQLVLAVADHGIGMAPDAVARIGEPFFQAQDGLSRRYEGTGLGLSIVKGLIDLHGGSLLVHSVLGEGTRVTVLLPLNGPATKLAESGEVTPLHAGPVSQQMTAWQDEKRKAL